ncbi:PREDICTED: E3 ubiquitin protein ligase DRIP2-like [Populus euphratica]|uniref:E3 ubiquitin protein ligase DRIP2-like n=1 Tax=Populus euphratica TaxID=75702 RepID=A0AAJ6XVI4_POPEU|nr:PREDICTED: E3 ubiquitin protein ligase DRIP2-like [Populus euphratica]
MSGQIVKVKREILEACMTCPLCNKLLKEATTIFSCLHTFCRKCIYEKLSDEVVDCCPVCNMNLGCLPVDKLRADHNLQDIRAKIFPFKRRKVKAPEIIPSIALPAKRKERSLSSLVVSTSKVPIQTGLTGRRYKAGARKAAALRGCSFTVEESKNEDSAKDNLSSPGFPVKSIQKKRLDSSVAEPSTEQRPNDDGEDDDVQMIEGKADLWTPLNCLVEAANRTKSSKLHSQGLSLAKFGLLDGPDSKPQLYESRAESPNGQYSDIYMAKTKNEHGQEIRVLDDKNGTNSLPVSVKRRRLTAAQKRAVVPEGLSASAQAMVDAAGAKSNRRNGPIWFSLVASEDQKRDASLPPISTCYLRIKDGKMPVSFIQKYLIKKLDLGSETELEIMCRGQPVSPTLRLQNLVNLWFCPGSTPTKVSASVGSSAKDFVMELSYCRKVQESQNIHLISLPS